MTNKVNLQKLINDVRRATRRTSPEMLLDAASGEKPRRLPPSSKCYFCNHARVLHGSERYRSHCRVAFGGYGKQEHCKCPGYCEKPKPSEWASLLRASKRAKNV
jgi:hypothetical protein